MNTWKGYIQFNGPECAVYEEVPIEVTDEEYEEINKAVAAGIPLSTLPFYPRMAYEVNCFDVSNCVDSNVDYFCLVYSYVYDPGDFTRFANNFIGKTYPDYATGETYTEFIDLDRCDGDQYAFYRCYIEFDENGTVIDITDISCEGVQSETYSGIDTVECYPDFDYFKHMLENYLLGIEDEDDY